MAIEGETVIVEQGNGDSGNDGIQKPVEKKVEGQVETKDQKPQVDWEKRFRGTENDLKKERAARQKYEGELKTEREALAAERKRVQALAGLTPKSDEETDTEAIRAQFAKLYPHLGALTAEDIEALRDVKKRQSDIDETNKHYWSQHRDKMFGQVHSAIEKAMGGGELSDRQRERINRAYALEAEQNPEFLDRHSKGDPKLAEEFAKGWVEDFIEPARRNYTRTETSRFRPVPSGKDRGIVTHGQQKIDVNDSKAVEDVLVRGFRERNGEFGRR